MNKNNRTRHLAESLVGGNVDRRSFLKLTGAGFVAVLPISTAPWVSASTRCSTRPPRLAPPEQA